jgi:hypothetical protein
MNIRTITIAVLIGMGLSLAGCATTPGTFANTSKVSQATSNGVSHLGDGVQLTDQHPGLLLRIEYVGGITERGMTVWRRSWRANEAQFFANNPSLEAYRARESDEFFNQRIRDQINKSGYYALRVFDYLKKHQRFPTDTIALSTVTLDADPTDPAGLRVLRATSQLPSVLTLRFGVMRNAHEVSDGNVEVYRNTFANYVSPEMILFSEAAAWPANGGVLFTTGLGDKYNAALLFSCVSDKCLSNAAELPYMPRLAPAYFSKSFQNIGALNELRELPYPLGTVLVPLQMAMPEKSIYLEQGLVRPLPMDFPLGDLVERTTLQALAQTDYYLATRMQWRQYIALYDLQLSRRWPNTGLTLEELERLNKIKLIMKAERHFVATASNQFTQTVLFGDAGAQMRQQFAAEGALMKGMQKQYWQDQVTGLITLGFSAGTQIAASGGHLAANQTMALSNQAGQLNTESTVHIDAMGSQFALGFDSATMPTALGSFFLDGQKIEVSTLTELRQRVADLYHRNFPSPIEFKYKRCSESLFFPSEDANTGAEHQTGFCDDNGLDMGPSFGLVRNRDGAFISDYDGGGSGTVSGVLNGPYFNHFAGVGVIGNDGVVQVRFFEDPQALYLAIKSPGTNWGDELDNWVAGKIVGYISWSLKGTNYYAVEGTGKRQPASPQQRQELEQLWSAWKSGRAKLIAHPR